MPETELVPETLLTPAPVPGLAEPRAPSPWHFQFTGEDALRLTVHNSQVGVVIAVNYRIQPPSGPTIAHAHAFTPTSDRSTSTVEWPLGLGYLLNVSLFTSTGAPKRGQTFARLQIIRGRGGAGVVLGTIVQGYVTGNQDRAWPGSPLEGSLEGDGYYRFIVGTDPAAGAHPLEVVPTGARWALSTWRVGLTASAVAGTRVPRLTFTFGGTPCHRSPSPGSVTAGSSADFHWATGMALETVLGGNIAVAGLPIGMVLIEGMDVRMATTAFDTADNYDTPVFTVREWLEAQ